MPDLEISKMWSRYSPFWVSSACGISCYEWLRGYSNFFVESLDVQVSLVRWREVVLLYIASWMTVPPIGWSNATVGATFYPLHALIIKESTN